MHLLQKQPSARVEAVVVLEEQVAVAPPALEPRLLALARELARVLEQAVVGVEPHEVLREVVRVAWVQLHRRNQQLQMRESTRRRASTRCRRLYAIADFRGQCASYQSWWRTPPQRRYLPLQLLQTTEPRCSIFSCFSSIREEYAAGLRTHALRDHHLKR